MEIGPTASQHSMNVPSVWSSKSLSMPAASRSASDSPIVLSAARAAAGATLPSVALRSSFRTSNELAKSPASSRSSASAIMSVAISTARASFSSMRSRSVMSSTDNDRTLSCCSDSTQSPSSGGRSRDANSSLRPTAPSSDA